MTDRGRVRITLSKLSQSLYGCCREAGIHFDEESWHESRSNLDELLDQDQTLAGKLFRLYGDKLRRTLHKDARFYDQGAVVVRNVDLVLDTTDWNPLLRLRGLFSWGVYFEECSVRIERNTNTLLGLGFAREIVFRRTRFVSGADEQRTPWGIAHVQATWLVNLLEGSSVSFEDCTFGNDHVQVRAFGKAKESLQRMTATRRAGGSGNQKGAGRNRRSKKAWDVLLPHNTPGKYPLQRITLLRNRQIDRLHIVSGTAELTVRGGNRLGTMRLPSNGKTGLPSRVSLGLFEEIDPTCRDPLWHRDTFLELRQLGTDTKDDALVRASTAQIDKIDHFLLKNDAVRLSNGFTEYAGHLQRRAILGWGYWVSNFNRSWLRCLTLLFGWYAGTSVLACWWVSPPLEADDVWSIVVRPLHDLPFLAKAIQEQLPQEWASVATCTKVMVSLIGLVQTTVTGMLTFSLVRSLRR